MKIVRALVVVQGQRRDADSYVRSALAAVNDKTLTSYDFMDEVLRTLARKDVFPNLKAIVMTGHSAGGQYVSRYEMSNRVHETLGVPVTYVVSNPSSCGYPDANRPVVRGLHEGEVRRAAAYVGPGPTLRP